MLTVIWLPIGVSQTYGFQTAAFVFTSTYNGTGAPDVWNWMLAFLSTSSVLTGFDASGHIAEETQDASLASARGIFWSAAISSMIAFVSLVLLDALILPLSLHPLPPLCYPVVPILLCVHWC